MIMITVTVQLLYCLCCCRCNTDRHQLDIAALRLGCIREFCIYTASSVIVDIIPIIAVVILIQDPSTDSIEIIIIRSILDVYSRI